VKTKHSEPATAQTSFGVLLRSIRNGRKLGLNQVAYASGIDPALLSKYETGKRLPPSVPMLMELAKALSLPEDSEDFGALLKAAQRGRLPGAAEALLEISEHVARSSANETPPVFCETRAELIAKATEGAITGNAIEITIKSVSGGIQQYRLLDRRVGRK
jgi:transcriptional regulator with XRE-family HTH domain